MGSYKPVDERDGEVWKPVKGWPMFEVSNHGRARRISLLNPIVKNNGYPAVYLTRGRNDRKCCLLHVLVAEAFIGPRPKGKVVHHKDHGRTNPRPENLEYVTPRENFDHAVRIGRMPTRMSGERSSMAKLTNEQVKEIRRLRKRYGYTYRELGTRFAVTHRTIRLIVIGETWPRTDHHALKGAE